jgi:integrase
MVQPSGHLAWKVVYSIRGRGPRWYHLGDGRAIPLADARKLAAGIMVQVAAGADPHADRLALRGRGTFGEVAGRYVEEYAKKKNKSWKQADALVTKHLLPRWGRLDVGAIRRADVKAAIAAIPKPALANQVLKVAGPIFSWAVRQEIITANPCTGIEAHDMRSRERILSDSEIVAFWPCLTAPLKLVLLTGQRPGEVSHLHQAHIVDGRWWVMPGAPDPATGWLGTKNAQTHRV